MWQSTHPALPKETDDELNIVEEIGDVFSYKAPEILEVPATVVWMTGPPKFICWNPSLQGSSIMK